MQGKSVPSLSLAKQAIDPYHTFSSPTQCILQELINFTDISTYRQVFFLSVPVVKSYYLSVFLTCMSELLQKDIENENNNILHFNSVEHSGDIFVDR